MLIFKKHSTKVQKWAQQECRNVVCAGVSELSRRGKSSIVMEGLKQRGVARAKEVSSEVLAAEL